MHVKESTNPYYSAPLKAGDIVRSKYNRLTNGRFYPPNSLFLVKPSTVLFYNQYVAEFDFMCNVDAVMSN